MMCVQEMSAVNNTVGSTRSQDPVSHPPLSSHPTGAFALVSTCGT